MFSKILRISKDLCNFSKQFANFQKNLWNLIKVFPKFLDFFNPLLKKYFYFDLSKMFAISANYTIFLIFSIFSKNLQQFLNFLRSKILVQSLEFLLIFNTNIFDEKTMIERISPEM